MRCQQLIDELFLLLPLDFVLTKLIQIIFTCTIIEEEGKKKKRLVCARQAKSKIRPCVHSQDVDESVYAIILISINGRNGGKTN